MRCSDSAWRPGEAGPAVTRVIKKQKFGVCAWLTLRRSPAWAESDLYALQNLRLTPSAFSTLSIHLSLCVLSPQSNITTTICHSDYQVHARPDTHTHAHTVLVPRRTHWFSMMPTKSLPRTTSDLNVAAVCSAAFFIVCFYFWKSYLPRLSWERSRAPLIQLSKTNLEKSNFAAHK